CQKTFSYIPYQSKIGDHYKELLHQDGHGTVGLILDEKIWTKSDAALTIFKLMGPPWNLLYYLRVIPKSMRDRIYLIIAKYRYSIFGRKEYCEL
ncbi:MAG TPA: DCC1-like thiol-disulfide oxidoreductase family protein, partial [Saprospiraceae bacterium]|nr:DCC1-like thiol-disulfide oxidoreductase family protein [Saprospiraceae bacterium]